MKSALGMCFNWKVLAGLAVIGGVVVVVAPGQALAVLPLLLLAACPLSMVVMAVTMGGMAGRGRKTRGPDASPSAEELHDRLARLEDERGALNAQLAATAPPVAVETGTPRTKS